MDLGREHVMGQIRRAALAAAMLGVLVTGTVGAAAPALRGFLPPGSGAHGHSLVAIATEWSLWAFGTGVGGPILDGRCEQSTIDSKIWFLPVSVGGDAPIVCDVPQGAFLFMSPGGSECSNLEDEPWFGADDADLLACVNETLPYLTYIDVTLDGRTSTDLDAYIATSRTVDLPAENLFSSDPGLSRYKGYFMVLAPMSRGTHTLRAYDEFFDGDFVGAVTYTINVH